MRIEVSLVEKKTKKQVDYVDSLDLLLQDFFSVKTMIFVFVKYNFRNYIMVTRGVTEQSTLDERGKFHGEPVTFFSK